MNNKYLSFIIYHLSFSVAILSFSVAILLAACGTKKTAVDTNVTPAPSVPSDSRTSVPTSPTPSDTRTLAARAFAKKVTDNAVYAKNIVGDMQFNLQSGSKDYTVAGSLHMRHNEVIRLQLFLPFIGTEVGRLEFTPDYVLVIDRLHKEYIQAGYNQVDFLAQNGLSFYSLQALFWNQLMVPGKKTVGEGDLEKFTINMDAAGQHVPLSLSNGKMKYQWNADKNSGQIAQALVTYQSTHTGRSQLTWNYANFRTVGTKRFPAQQQFTFKSAAVKGGEATTITISMSEVKTDDKWEARTTPSSKYKKVEATDILSRLMK